MHAPFLRGIKSCPGREMDESELQGTVCLLDPSSQRPTRFCAHSMTSARPVQSSEKEVVPAATAGGGGGGRRCGVGVGVVVVAIRGQISLFVDELAVHTVQQQRYSSKTRFGVKMRERPSGPRTARRRTRYPKTAPHPQPPAGWKQQAPRHRIKEKPSWFRLAVWACVCPLPGVESPSACMAPAIFVAALFPKPATGINMVGQTSECRSPQQCSGGIPFLSWFRRGV